MSTTLEIVQVYFKAWNAHNSDLIAELFTENGEYRDPVIKIRGRNISTYTHRLWEAFPDLSFEIVSQTEPDHGLIATEWCRLHFRSACSG